MSRDCSAPGGVFSVGLWFLDSPTEKKQLGALQSRLIFRRP